MVSKTKEIQKTFSEISEKIQYVNKLIQELMPQTILRQTTSFGNSSHVVLSKEYLDKKVGVIVFESSIEKNKKEVKNESFN